MESDVIGQLHSPTGADGVNPEGRGRGKEAGDPDCFGSDCANGGEVEIGARGRPTL
jgi:hypothetical protein